MTCTRFHLPTVFALALGIAVVSTARVPTAAGLDDKTIKLSGCLVKGDGDGAGYLLTNSPMEPSLSSNNDSHVSPGAIGTTGTYANIFYWLDGDHDLRDHIG